MERIDFHDLPGFIYIQSISISSMLDLRRGAGDSAGYPMGSRVTT